MAKLDKESSKATKDSGHMKLKVKQEEMDRLNKALGIDKRRRKYELEYKFGDAFDNNAMEAKR